MMTTPTAFFFMTLTWALVSSSSSSSSPESHQHIAVDQVDHPHPSHHPNLRASSNYNARTLQAVNNNTDAPVPECSRQWYELHGDGTIGEAYIQQYVDFINSFDNPLDDDANTMQCSGGDVMPGPLWRHSDNEKRISDLYCDLSSNPGSFGNFYLAECDRIGGWMATLMDTTTVTCSMKLIELREYPNNPNPYSTYSTSIFSVTYPPFQICIPRRNGEICGIQYYGVEDRFNYNDPNVALMELYNGRTFVDPNKNTLENYNVEFDRCAIGDTPLDTSAPTFSPTDIFASLLNDDMYRPSYHYYDDDDDVISWSFEDIDENAIVPIAIIIFCACICAYCCGRCAQRHPDNFVINNNNGGGGTTAAGGRGGAASVSPIDTTTATAIRQQQQQEQMDKANQHQWNLARLNSFIETEGVVMVSWLW